MKIRWPFGKNPQKKEEKQLDEAAKKTEKLEEKVAKAVRKDKSKISYKIYRNSSNPEARGWLGTIDAISLSNFDSVEEYLKTNYGGGFYSLHELKDGVPTGNIMRYTIAGQPFVERSGPISYPTPPAQTPLYGPQYGAPSPQEEQLKRRIEELEKQLQEAQRKLEEEKHMKELELLKREIEMIKGDKSKGMLGELAGILEKAIGGNKDESALSSIIQASSQLQQTLFESQRQMSDRIFEMMVMLMQQGGGDALTAAVSGIAQLLLGRREGQSSQPALSGASQPKPQSQQSALTPAEMLQAVAQSIRERELPEAVASQISSIWQMLQRTGKPVPPELGSFENLSNFIRRNAPDDEYAGRILSLFQEEGGDESSETTS